MSWWSKFKSSFRLVAYVTLLIIYIVVDIFYWIRICLCLCIYIYLYAHKIYIHICSIIFILYILLWYRLHFISMILIHSVRSDSPQSMFLQDLYQTSYVELHTGFLLHRLFDVRLFYIYACFPSRAAVVLFGLSFVYLHLLWFLNRN